MKLEETDDYIVFRECVIAKEMAQKYPDGMIVKTAEELKRMDDLNDTDLPVTHFFDGHKKERLVGFIKKPKGIASFENGKLRRDIFFDKEILTPDEIVDVRMMHLSNKKDLSVGFQDKTEYRNDKWKGISVNGYSKDMKLDHVSWEKSGRCSTEDGCGLTRSDTKIIRYDSLDNYREDADEDGCIAKKMKMFMSEGMDGAKAKAAAVKYCQAKDKPEKKKKSEKIKGDNVTEDKDKVEVREDKSDEIIAGIASLNESISSLVTQLQPIIKTDSVRKDSDNSECEEEVKDEESGDEQKPNDEITKRLDALEKENTELKDRFDNVPRVPIRKSYTLAELDKIKEDKDKEKDD